MPTESLAELAALLGNDFEEIRPLGADGGMSRLFRARKISLGMDVVIKRMQIDHSDPASVKREAKVMTGLRHQFLPRILDFKSDSQGGCYTIMELIPGCTLRQYVQQKGALSQKQTLFWMRQITQALEYMHGHRPAIIHSDIKPENIMITPEGDICLIDFNASLEMRDDPVHAVGATLCYAAPEQYNIPLSDFGDPSAMTEELRTVYTIATHAQDKGPLTPRTDLYALGAVSYFMLTGYDPRPWCEQPIPLERFAIQLSEPLRQVIERCMQTDPGLRFSSAKELMRALENLARMDQKYKKFKKSCRLTALGIGAGVILSAFCCVWGVLMLNKENASAYNELILQAQQKAQMLDHAGERQLLLDAIQLDRKRPEAYANLGAALYRMGDYQQAIELLSALKPEQSSGLNHEQAVQAQSQIQYILGCCYYELQQYEKAMPCYQLAAALSAEEVSYQRDLAICYAQLGYDEKSVEAVEKLKQMDIRAGDGEFAAGEIDFAAGRVEKALEELLTAVRVSEDNSIINRAALRASQCCTSLGPEWADRQQQMLETAANRLGSSDNYRILQELAHVLLETGEPADAERSLKLAEELAGRGAPGYSVQETRAQALRLLGRAQEAQQGFEELAKAYPADYRPQMWLALMELEQQTFDSQRFEEHFQQAAAKYAAAGAFDGNMERLIELAAGHGA